MTFFEIELEPTQTFRKDSDEVEFTPGKRYVVTTEYEGFEGKPFCAYVAVIFEWGKGFNERRIEWLNDFSGSTNQAKLVFIAPAKKATLIYRINDETQQKSKCKFKLLPLESISIKECGINDPEFQNSESFIAPRVSELESEKELLLEKNLVWVMSTKRSGSTWLTEELLSIKTDYINEPDLGLYLGKSAPPFSDKLSDMEYFAHRPDYFFSLQFKNTWLYYLRKLILNRIYAQIPDFSKKIIIQENSGTGFTTISECLPNSKIIVLLRDGRDTVDSSLDARVNLVPGGRFTGMMNNPLGPKGRIDFVKNASKNWIKSMQILKQVSKSHTKNNLYEIKYENLRYNTFKEISKIYKFLGIDVQEDKLKNIVERSSFENVPNENKGVGKSKRFASPGKWKDNLTDEEKNIMEEIMRSTLHDLDYQ